MAQSKKTLRRLKFKRSFIRTRATSIYRSIKRIYLAWYETVIKTLASQGVRKDINTAADFGEEAFFRRFIDVSERLSSEIFIDGLESESALARISIGRDTENTLAEQYIKRTDFTYRNLATRDVRLIRNIISESVGLPDQREIFRPLELKFQQLTGRGLALLSRNLTSQAYSESRRDFWNSQAPGVMRYRVWLPSIGGDNDRTWHNSIPSRGPIAFNEKFTIISPYYGTIQVKGPNDFTYPGEASACMCDEEFTDSREEADRASAETQEFLENFEGEENAIPV